MFTEFIALHTFLGPLCAPRRDKLFAVQLQCSWHIALSIFVRERTRCSVLENLLHFSTQYSAVCESCLRRIPCPPWKFLICSHLAALL